MTEPSVEGLSFVGVPAHAVPAKIRAAIEQAWFEQRTLRVSYEDRDGSASERLVRLRGIVFERGVTLLQCDDLGKGEPRQLRLDRVRRASVE